MYIVINRQTVSLYHNSSVWLDTQDASSWDQNPPNFMLHTHTHTHTHIYIYGKTGS